MPNRLIRERIIQSASLNALQPLAELLFYRLLVIADDRGRIIADIEYIRSAAMPYRMEIYTKSKTQEYLGELEEHGIIVFYRVDNREFCFFPKWEAFQQIRNVRAKCPDPNNMNVYKRLKACKQSVRKLLADCGILLAGCDDLLADCPPNPNPNPNPTTNPNAANAASDDSQKTNSKKSIAEEKKIYALQVIDAFTETFPYLEGSPGSNSKTQAFEKCIGNINARRQERNLSIQDWKKLFESLKGTWLESDEGKRCLNIAWITLPTNFEKAYGGFYGRSNESNGSGLAGNAQKERGKKVGDAFIEEFNRQQQAITIGSGKGGDT